LKFQKLLQKLKRNSTHPVHKVSAVIAKKNQVISIGFNKYKTHTRSLHPWKYLHAELDAILDNKFADLKGSTIYIYRETRDGVPAISKPCESCMNAIRLAGIKKICYSYQGTFKEEKV
jgi:deoxycytidylate deaminase